MGRTDAISLGSDHAAQLGYRDSELLGVEEIYPNIWRVKFGLAPKGSGKILQLDFDGQSRTLLKRTELDGVTGEMVPSSGR